MKAPELEALLVGALLDSPEPLKLLQAAGIQPETFSDGQFRVCWDIAWQLARQGKRVDAATLYVAGRATNRLREGDLGTLEMLQGRNTLTPGSFIRVAEELRRYAHSRMLGQQLSELGKELLAGANPATTHRRFDAIHDTYGRLHAEGRRGSTAVVAAFEAFERRRKEGQRPLVPTGLELFDKRTGGLPPKLCCFVGEPGVGKSALIATMIYEQLRAGLTVVLFSLEDGDEWLIKRHLARMLEMKVRDVFASEFPDGARAALAGQELADQLDRLWLITNAQVGDIADVLRISTQYVAQQNAQVFWLDNATALGHRPSSKFEPPNLAAGRMYESLAKWADQYRTPFVVLAHTTRKYQDRTQGRGPPAISDIAETAAAERFVRMGLGLWKKKGGFRITVLKHTEGESGTTLEFGMNHDAILVDGSSGREINLHQEAREERAEAHERKLESDVADKYRRKEIELRWKPKQEPSEEPKPDAQLSLLDTPKEEK